MSDHEPSEPTAGIPLEASVDELRRRREAVGRLQGGSTHYEEELGIFRDYAAESGITLPHPPPELSRPPDEEGNEHQVWFDNESCTYLKATWPGFYGLQVIHRHDEEAKASPIAYLERWLLHNEMFGDQVQFVGVLGRAAQMRLLIRQPAIKGIPATAEQIEEFFTGNGWRRFTTGGEVAFFDPGRNVAVSDTHRGNLILMDDGMLAPIDLRVQALSGALLDIVVKLCGS